MTSFNPNAAAPSDSGIFGLPFDEARAALVYLPVPWEVTTSYGGGTSGGPAAILAASRQVDLYDLDVLRPYEAGLYMLPESSEIITWNKTSKILAGQIIAVGGEITTSALRSDLDIVNKRGEQLNQYVYKETKRLLNDGKIVAVVGGDHSVPFGALKAIAEKHPSFGILHFDAHSDTRKAYEGFEWSHASIMHNVLEHIPQVGNLTQVGIRDICEEEIQYTHSQSKRVKTFFDRDLLRRKFLGENWNQIAEEIVSTLPEQVWISFDIDGLDPRFCPNTGTPVPGGLDLAEANYLLSVLVKSGRKIIGFDLNEVSPNTTDENDEWDANVGARLLYKLTAWTLASRGLAQLRG
ncbi:MAG: agmatinase family protein [Bdellovibrionia bacterium]